MKKAITLLLILLFAVTLVSCGEKPLTLDQTELDMIVGDSAELDAGGAVKVHWSSSNDAVATVSAGTVSAKSAGEAVITAALENGESASCKVTVADKLITGITLSASSTRIEAGKTIQLSASYAPADASSHALSWESSDESIAAVDPDGYVTAISEGVAKITCKSENGIEASCTVTVGAAQVPTSAATLPPATEKPTETPTQSAPTQPAAKPADDDDDPPVTPVSGGVIFPDSSTRYLSQSEIEQTLSGMSGTPAASSFAQDAITEIYARNGYIFRTPEIRAYYEAQPWYHPNPYYDGSLNPVELYNVGLLSGF